MGGAFMNIILVATAWGPRFGGINAFNQDFALGLASYIAPASVPDRKVFCLVPKCSRAEIEAAERGGVRLVEIPEAQDSNLPFGAIAPAVQLASPGIPPMGSNDYWVGHDVITGSAAITAAHASGSKSALIMHMNFESYKYLQDGDIECERRSKEQRDIFKRADRRFAVGPLLKNELQDMVGGDVHMLIPGLCDIEPRTATKSLRGIAFGRLDRHNDIIKQGSLVAASFGRAVRLMQESKDNDLEELTASFKMFGATSDEDAFAFHDLADEQAKGIAPIHALPFEEIREEIFDALARANLAIVPSLHDGFALTGWEAIAAETPLILSRNTGLWKLLVELWSPSIAKALVTPVHVHGRRHQNGEPHYTEEDVALIADAIVDGMRHRHERIRLAAELKRGLQSKRDGCTWEKTGEDFLIGIGLVDAVEVAEARFVGNWTGFFIEGSQVRVPEIVRERISVSRAKNAHGLHGSSSYSVNGEGRSEDLMDLVVHGGVLSGHTTVTKGYTRDSWCQFQVAPKCGGKLMEGVATWSSTVETLVDWSRYIWVEDMPGNEDLLAFAEREMLRELEATRQRIDERVSGSYPAIDGAGAIFQAIS